MRAVKMSIFTLIACSACVHDGSKARHSAPLSAAVPSHPLLAPQALHELRSSVRLALEQDDVAGAIKLLSAHRVAGDLPPDDLAMLAGLLEDADDLANAESALRDAVATARTEDDISKFRADLGACLWRERKYPEAVAALNAALRCHDVCDADAPVYARLAVARKTAGDVAGAVLAAAASLVFEPRDKRVWGLFELPPLKGAWTTVSPEPGIVPHPLAWSKMRPLLLAGPPARWSAEVARSATTAYAEYSQELERAGLSGAAKAYADLAHLSPYLAAFAAVRRNEVARALELFDVARQTTPIADLDLDLQGTVYRDLVHSYGDQGHVLQGIASATKLFELCRPAQPAAEMRCHLLASAPSLYESTFVETASAEALAFDVSVLYLAKLLQRTFVSVCWDVVTHARKSDDSDDFLGNLVSIHSTTIDGRQIVTRRPYGATDPEEDWVVFQLASLGPQREDFARRFRAAVRRRKLTFVVKAMLVEVARPIQFGALPPGDQEMFFGVSMADLHKHFDVPELTERASARQAFSVALQTLDLLRDLAPAYYSASP